MVFLIHHVEVWFTFIISIHKTQYTKLFVHILEYSISFIPTDDEYQLKEDFLFSPFKKNCIQGYILKIILINQIEVESICFSELPMKKCLCLSLFYYRKKILNLTFERSKIYILFFFSKINSFPSFVQSTIQIHVCIHFKI